MFDVARAFCLIFFLLYPDSNQLSVTTFKGACKDERHQFRRHVDMLRDNGSLATYTWCLEVVTTLGLLPEADPLTGLHVKLLGNIQPYSHALPDRGTTLPCWHPDNSNDTAIARCAFTRMPGAVTCIFTRLGSWSRMSWAVVM